MTTAKVKVSKKIAQVFAKPRGSWLYRYAYGGRGSGKSYSFALMAAIWASIEAMRVLCAREMQNSIKESFHQELKAAITAHPWLEAQYDIGVDYIRCNTTGSEFIFKGLRHNVGSIKSLAKIDLTIIEEAEDVPEESWLALEATVLRQPRSEIWAIWNPKMRGSPVDKRFRADGIEQAAGVEMNYHDNPWFPVGLEALRVNQQRTLDPATYAHIWEGAYWEKSDAQVFRDKYEISEFTPENHWDGPYFGLDFGFANDPTAATKSWVYDDTLYIEYDYAKVGLELDDTAGELAEAIPDITKHTVIADNARPESISYLKRHGLPYIEACKKGKGSVEDGISHIKSYSRVVIHPRCKATTKEFLLYSYKTDRLSGKVMPDLVDANNHNIDALRYSLEPIMKQTNMMGLIIPKRRR